MKSIDLKKYYPHPLHEGENTVILVTDEVANALERFIREENNDTLRRYRAKAYYSLDCENGIEHHTIKRPTVGKICGLSVHGRKCSKRKMPPEH